MSKDKQFGSLLLLAGIASGFLIGMFFILGNEGIPSVMLVIPGILVLLGLAVIFFDFVEEHLEIDDEITQFSELIADDLEELKSGHITYAHVLIAASAFAFLMEVLLIFLYRKWDADWGIFNVLLVSIVVCLVGTYFVIKTRWFQNRRRRTPAWISLVPMGGFVVCALLGMYFTEPGSALPVNQTGYVYHFEDSRVSNTVIYQNNFFDVGNSVSDVDIDCHGDSCGEALLGLLLLLVVAACILGSFFIPHFWVLATLLLAVIMALIAIRELLYSDDHRPAYWW